MKTNQNRFHSIIILFALVFIQFANPQPARAACSGVVYVDANSTAGTPDGCTWGTAFVNLQDAIALAGSGDQIWVAEGTYYPDQGAGQNNDNRDSTFGLKSGVAIYGGFAGTETVLDPRNLQLHVTILSGDIGTLGDTSDNAYHVVSAIGASNSTILDGLTVTAGNANAGDNFGGGVYISHANLALTHVIITNNAAGNGGGVYSISSQPAFQDVIFSNNTATFHGGGIFASSSNASFTNVVFTANISGHYGGGIYNLDGSPTLLNVTFDSNRTLTSASPGAGMHNSNNNPGVITVAPVLTNVTFSNNVAQLGGAGGLFNYVSNPVLTNVTFSGNSAYVRGGAILNEGSSPTFNNVTFSGNTAPAGTGGAMRNIFADVGTPSAPIVKNTILWGNGSEEVVNDAGNTITIMNSVVKGGCPVLGTCTNGVNSDPALVALANNGGFTNTMALGAGSSAIDAGNTSTCAATDQRGVTRPLGAACDAGAYEALTYTLTTATVGDGTVTRSSPGPYFPGDVVNLTAVPNPGSTFTGWSGACTGTGACVVTMDGNKTVTVTFGTLPPAAFSKGSPANGSTGIAANQILNWLPSVGMSRYEYCYDTTNDGACSNWVDSGTNRKPMISGLNPVTTYYWQARAVNDAGITFANGSETDYWSFTTADLPGTFGKAILANGTTGASINPSLTWGASSVATTYEYCYDTTNDGTCSTWVSTGGARNVTLSGLSPSTTYYWQVRAKNSFGATYANGAETAYWSFTTATPPGALGKGVPSNGATGLAINPTLTWGASSGAGTYEYCYDTTDDGACGTWVSTGGGRNVILSGLSPATTYYWQVRAKNSFGTTYANGAETAYWSFTTATPPGALGKTIPSNGATGLSVNPALIWGPSSGVSTYEYCYDTTDDGACSTWVNVGGARYAMLSGLSPATTYYWQVRAKNSFGTTYANGAETAYWSFTTASPPGTFSKSIPANGQTGAAINPTLTWGGSSGASTYEYCYDTTDDGACSTWVSTGGGRNVILSGLSPATTYYWQVRAKNGFGITYANGAETAYWSFTTVNPPGVFGKGIPANGQAGLSVNPTLTWGPSSGVSTYEYCYDTTDDGVCSIWTNSGGARYAFLSGLTPGVTYYWQVRAVNSAGITYANGSETAYWTFTIKP